jgi:hypothetical protein
MVLKDIHYNIEYSHIYLDEAIDEEKMESIRIAKSIIKLFKNSNQKFTANVMLDDYNPVEKTLNVETFLKTLKSNGVPPDYIIYESKLTKYSNFLINKMSKRLENEYTKYIKTKGFVPCSLLIAIWHLARLGEITLEKGDIIKLGDKNVSFTADQLISVLPERYSGVERRASKILKDTGYSKVLEKIENIYF